MARPVGCAELQEGLDFGLQSVQGQPACGIIAAKVFNQVAGEETLNVAQHACGAPVQLIHLTWRQQYGLTVRTEQKEQIKVKTTSGLCGSFWIK